MIDINSIVKKIAEKGSIKNTQNLEDPAKEYSFETIDGGWLKGTGRGTGGAAGTASYIDELPFWT